MAWADTAFAVVWWLAAIAVLLMVLRERWADVDLRVLIPGATVLLIYVLHQATGWDTWLQITGFVIVISLSFMGLRLLMFTIPPLEGCLWPVWVLWHGVVDSWILVLAVAFSDSRDWDAADPRDASTWVWGVWLGVGILMVTWSIAWKVQRHRAHAQSQGYETV